MLTELRPAEAMTLTVLVVDDQPVTLSLTARMLRNLGYAALTTDAPRSAIVLAEGGARIDCVLTDLTMPGMSGQELAKHLRDISPDVPVVFMSGYPEDLSEAIGGGRPSIHLDKPFSMAALHVALREAIGE